MGRHKQNKPRRPRRPRGYTLHELQPPGQGYDDWIDVPAGLDPGAINDPRVKGEHLEMMARIARLGPIYGGRMPEAALVLDMLIDGGQLPIAEGEENGVLVPMAELAERFGAAGDIRETIHRLHSAGMLLVVDGPDDESSFVRMVMQKPAEPGQPWRFVGDPDAVVAMTCLPDGMWDALPTEVAATVAYMRSRQGQLEEPDPAEYGTHEGVNGEAHARELFAAAQESGWVDYKGCGACPAGHLCTREEVLQK